MHLKAIFPGIREHFVESISYYRSTIVVPGSTFRMSE